MAFNDCSVNHVVDHDIQCGQLRGLNDEGQDNLGIGEPPPLSSRSMEAQALTTTS